MRQVTLSDEVYDMLCTLIENERYGTERCMGKLFPVDHGIFNTLLDRLTLLNQCELEINNTQERGK